MSSSLYQFLEGQPAESLTGCIFQHERKVSRQAAALSRSSHNNTQGPRAWSSEPLGRAQGSASQVGRRGLWVPRRWQQPRAAVTFRGGRSRSQVAAHSAVTALSQHCEPAPAAGSGPGNHPGVGRPELPCEPGERANNPHSHPRQVQAEKRQQPFKKLPSPREGDFSTGAKSCLSPTAI